MEHLRAVKRYVGGIGYGRALALFIARRSLTFSLRTSTFSISSSLAVRPGSHIGFELPVDRLARAASVSTRRDPPMSATSFSSSRSDLIVLALLREKGLCINTLIFRNQAWPAHALFHADRRQLFLEALDHIASAKLGELLLRNFGAASVDNLLELRAGLQNLDVENVRRHTLRISASCSSVPPYCGPGGALTFLPFPSFVATACEVLAFGFVVFSDLAFRFDSGSMSRPFGGVETGLPSLSMNSFDYA